MRELEHDLLVASMALGLTSLPALASDPASEDEDLLTVSEVRADPQPPYVPGRVFREQEGLAAYSRPLVVADLPGMLLSLGPWPLRSYSRWPSP